MQLWNRYYITVRFYFEPAATRLPSYHAYIICTKD